MDFGSVGGTPILQNTLWLAAGMNGKVNPP